MHKIIYTALVIVCEACKQVRRLPVQNYEECIKIFEEYRCPNGCGENLYSFFTVGQVEK